MAQRRFLFLCTIGYHTLSYWRRPHYTCERCGAHPR